MLCSAGDSSHAGQYHYFTVSCINNTFAMLNVKETGKYYSSVTIEMTCTNELLNTTVSASRINIITCYIFCFIYRTPVLLDY